MTSSEILNPPVLRVFTTGSIAVISPRCFAASSTPSVPVTLSPRKDAALLAALSSSTTALASHALASSMTSISPACSFAGRRLISEGFGASSTLIQDGRLSKNLAASSSFTDTSCSTALGMAIEPNTVCRIPSKPQLPSTMIGVEFTTTLAMNCPCHICRAKGDLHVFNKLVLVIVTKDAFTL